MLDFLGWDKLDVGGEWCSHSCLLSIFYTRTHPHARTNPKEPKDIFRRPQERCWSMFHMLFVNFAASAFTYSCITLVHVQLKSITVALACLLRVLGWQTQEDDWKLLGFTSNPYFKFLHPTARHFCVLLQDLFPAFICHSLHLPASLFCLFSCFIYELIRFSLARLQVWIGMSSRC